MELKWSRTKCQNQSKIHHIVFVSWNLPYLPIKFQLLVLDLKNSNNNKIKQYKFLYNFS
jgi:hypothetical protein